MLKGLDRLTASEVEILVKAPLLVCILIAGADNEIDRKEVKGAIELAETGSVKATMAEFFAMVSEDFEDKLKIILQLLPAESSKRNPLIFEDLSLLNKILPKLARSFAVDYYKCLRHIAEKIAESSGGVLGMKSIGAEESELMTLPMIKDPSAPMA